MHADIIIVGAGPAGLSFARTLAPTGLSIILVERQEVQELAEPSYDGREIALTHRSVRIMRELGQWRHLPDGLATPLRQAHVLNGASPLALQFDSGGQRGKALGQLLSNHHIRRIAFEAVRGQPGLTLLPSTEVSEAEAGAKGATVVLAGGRTMSARLLVAADSRFSSVRTKLGIGTEMNVLGKAMLVCRVAHEGEHGGIATEWFGHRQTIAMLPLAGRTSSAVLTLPLPEAERLASLDDEELGLELTRRYSGRLGSMRVTSSRHVYPLVTTFASCFAGPGAALIGDAAVGMHPVTAHGFNLGLLGATTLAGLIRKAKDKGRDWASAAVLDAYAAEHRRASLPLYRATNAIVRLYNDERRSAGIARDALIRLGCRLPFVNAAVRSMLLQA